MKKLLRSPLFGLLMLGFYVFIIWTTFRPYDSVDVYTHFFSYDLNVYSVAFIFFNIIFGLILGIGHIPKERQKSGRWGFKFVRFFTIGIPLIIWSLGSYIHFDLGIFRGLYLYHGILAMGITESVGFYYSMAFLLLCGYVFQICLGYLISKCIYKAERA